MCWPGSWAAAAPGTRWRRRAGSTRRSISRTRRPSGLGAVGNRIRSIRSAGVWAADVVRAGGGAARRRVGGGRLETVIVHRQAYDDWSLPKGKVDPGETDEQTARREVEEETGLVCRLGAELPSTSYRDRHGRRKVVRYWAMTPESGEV